MTAVATVVAAAAAAGPPERPAQSPVPPRETPARKPAEPGTVRVFVDGPGGLDVLTKRLEQPDFVILPGSEYERLTRPRAGPSTGAERPAVVSVLAAGSVAGDVAEMEVRYEIALPSDGPAWAPIGLNGVTAVTFVRDGKTRKDLPARSADAGGWEVQLAGPGRGEVAVGILLPVRSVGDARRIELAIPEAPTTRLDVTVPAALREARTGPREPVSPRREAGREAASSRLTADLTPRSRIALEWTPAESRDRLPALLSAQGEIALDVEPGALRARGSWSIRSQRGEARSLIVRLDSDDELLALELDGQPPTANLDRDREGRRVTITLPEPLAAGQERRLVIATRRSLTGGPSARAVFSGFPIASAREQSGAIGIVASDGLWVTASPVRGVRQIDPRLELPAELRARPDTELAYRFSEQPFELQLRVEPSPPIVRASATTFVTLDPAAARLDARYEFETSRGRLYNLSFALPPGLSIESVGPPEVAAGWQVGALPTTPTPVLAYPGLRLLSVRLGTKSPEGGRFSLRLVGRTALGESTGAVRLGLPQSLGVASSGGRTGVVAEPGVSVDVDDSASAFRHTPGLGADALWPSALAPGAAPAVWFQYDGAPAELPLRLVRSPASTSTSTTATVRLDARGADVQQDVECSIQNGAGDHIALRIPARLEGRWELDGATRAAERGEATESGRMWRVHAPVTPGRPTRLRIRYRLPFDAPPGESPGRLELPLVQVVGATSTSERVRIEAPEELSVEPGDAAWTIDPSFTPERGVVNLTGVGDAATLSVRARRRAALPRVLATRVWLATDQAPDGALRSRACFRLETSEAAVSVLPPPGASLRAVRVNGRLIEEVERLPSSGAIRIELPRGAAGGARTVELEYSVPAAQVSGGWVAPRLLGDALVLESYWQVRVPWNRAVLGAPDGWREENAWRWDVFPFRREPRTSTAALAAWVGTSDAVGPFEREGSESQLLLFARSGEPGALPIVTAARALLVAACSGAVLVCGGLLMNRRRAPGRTFWLAFAGLALAAAALLKPSVIVLLAQSGWIGVLLTLLIAVMQRLVVGGGRRGSGYVEPAPATSTSGLGGSPPGSTASRVVGVGSDDSTAIRGRPVSTVDHVPAVAAEPVARGGAEP
jgi:hypothetical protein